MAPMRSIVRTGSKTVIVAAHYHSQWQIRKHELPFFTISLSFFLRPSLLGFFLSGTTLCFTWISLDNPKVWCLWLAIRH
jgi:hypothetical protein